MRRAPAAALAVLGAALWTASCRTASFLEPVRPPRPFQVMAHRGEMNQAPENTRPALERAIEDGLEWAEVDLRLTRDGRHVLLHDASVESAAGPSGEVKQLTLAELKAIDLGSRFSPEYRGVGPLALEECFEVARGRINLYLDSKEVDPELLARQVLEAGMERQVVVYGRPEMLKRVREASRGRVAVMTKWRPEFGVEGWLRAFEPQAVEVDADQVSREVCQAFHERDIKVEAKNLGPWDNPEAWERVLAAGVDWIQTDLPEEVLAHALWKRVRKRPVLVCLQGGASRHAPEGTRAALEKAFRMGADFMQMEVRASAAGRFFLCPERLAARRAAGRSGPWSAGELEGLDAGDWFGKPYAGHKLLDLEEALAAARDRIGAYIDAREIPPEALAEALERSGMTGRAVVHQEPAYLRRLQRRDGRIRIAPPLAEAAGLEPLVGELRPYAVSVPWESLTRELIERCHARGVRVFASAQGRRVQSEDYLKAIEAGVDLIQTDHALCLLRAVELWEWKGAPPAASRVALRAGN